MNTDLWIEHTPSIKHHRQTKTHRQVLVLMISSPHHSWVLQSQTSTQKRTYRHTRHMIRWQIHTTKTLSLAWGSVASSSFQPCVLNKHCDTDTQTKSNTDNPHLRARLLFQLPTVFFKHWQNKNLDTNTKKHTYTNLRANLVEINCQSFPSNTGTKNTITRT